MPHFKSFNMINLKYEIEFGKKFLIKPQMTKTSQDNNGIIISILSIFQCIFMNILQKN